jgi:hypothetical protein
MKEIVTGWLKGLAVGFYDERIVKPVQHLDKSLIRNGNYVENKCMLYLIVILKLCG